MLVSLNTQGYRPHSVHVAARQAALRKEIIIIDRQKIKEMKGNLKGDLRLVDCSLVAPSGPVGLSVPDLGLQ
jgi:hypothetical protein